jgi:signal transduction histidine kinase
MYITGLVICLIIAVVILAADPKMESNRWYSAATFAYGFLWIGLIFKNRLLLPKEFFYIIDAETWEGFFYSITHYFLPYCSMMYAFSYTGVLARWKNRMAMVLLIPIVFMYLVFPVTTFCRPDSKRFTMTMSTLLLWLVPYLLGAAFLLLVSYLRAKNKWEKQDRMLICILSIPCIFLVIFIEFLYGFYKLNINNAAKISMACGVFELTMILFGIISYGIFGVKLQVEKNRLSGTIQSMTFGTAFLNHIIKNEILKVAMCTENIKPYLRKDEPMLNDSIALISNSTQRMLFMIERIQKQMGEFKVKITPSNIIAIIEDSLFNLKPLLEAKNIKVRKEYTGEAIIPCDSFHLREVFNNLFRNAIEAMKPGGELTIAMSRLNKQVVFAIKDNGSGIDKEDLPHVMEPFFSTKDRKNNFGLGLPYCYNVMQRHAGTLEIFSKKGEGTTVFLNFAKSKKVGPG